MENDVNSTIDAAIIRMADKVKAETDAVKVDLFSSAAKKLAETKSILSMIPAKGSSESKK